MLKLKIMTRKGETHGLSSWLIKHWPTLILIGLTIFYFLPYFVFPAFNLIDDGWSLSVARQLSQHFSITRWLDILVEDEIGRLRPLYYLYFWVVYQFSGTNPLGYWIGQALTIFVSLLLSWKILFKLTGKKMLSLLPVLLFLLMPAVSENTYRLGTAEPRQLVFILGAIWWMLELRTHRLTLLRGSVGVVLFWAALFTKETSLFFLPVFIVFYVLERLRGNFKQASYLALTLVLGFSAIAFVLLIPESKAYSSSYQLTLQSFWLRVLQTRLNAAPILLPMAVATFLTVIRAALWLSISPFKTLWTHFIDQLLLFTIFAASLLIILPWEMLLERYFYLVTLFISMYIALELNGWFALPTKVDQRMKQQGVLLTWIACVGLGALTFGIFQGRGLTFWQLPLLTWTNLQGQFDTYQISYSVIKHAEQLPDNANIFVAHNDYEVIYEIGLFATHDGQRPATVYSQNDQLIRDFGPRYPYLLLAANEASVSAITKGNFVTLFRGRQQSQYQHLNSLELKPAARLFSEPQQSLWWYAGTL